MKIGKKTSIFPKLLVLALVAVIGIVPMATKTAKASGFGDWSSGSFQGEMISSALALQTGTLVMTFDSHNSGYEGSYQVSVAQEGGRTIKTFDLFTNKETSIVCQGITYGRYVLVFKCPAVMSTQSYTVTYLTCQ